MCSVSIAGGIQPTPFVRTIGAEQSVESGMASRFLLCKVPMRESPYSEVEITGELQLRTQKVFDYLRNLNFDSEDNPVPIHLAGDAHELFKVAHDRYEATRKYTAVAYPQHAQWLGKAAGRIVRMALVFQCAIDAEAKKKEPSFSISPDAMERAITLHDWYARENARITKWLSSNHTANAALQRIDRETTAIEHVVELVKQYGGKIARTALRGMEGGSKLVRVFDNMAAMGLIVEDRKKNPKGKPTVEYRLPTEADELETMRRKPR